MRQIPPAYSQSHQDIDTADPTLYYDRPLRLSPPESPIILESSFEYLDEPSPSGRKKPEQSNSSALEAAEEDVDYPSFDWSAPYPDAYKGPGNYSVEQKSPVKTPTMRNVGSEQLETGSYDTTRSTYFYPDTSHLDTRRRAQTPTTRPPEPPLSPTTMSAALQQRNTSDSANALDPATEHAATFRHNGLTQPISEEAIRRWSEKLIDETTKKEMNVRILRNENLAPPPPPSGNKSPDDTSPHPSATQPVPMPSGPDLNSDSDSDFSPRPIIKKVRKERKKVRKERKNPPAPSPL
jgi:hypothetical protein